MRNEHIEDSPEQDASSDPDIEAARSIVSSTEDIHIRNYDMLESYDLAVEVVDEDDEVVFRERYYLQPGETMSELDVLTAGDYDVRVMLDNHREKETRCRVDESSEHAILIEVGNGTVSVTEGLY